MLKQCKVKVQFQWRNTAQHESALSSRSCPDEEFLLAIVSVLFAPLLFRAHEVTIERSTAAVHGKSYDSRDLRSIRSGEPENKSSRNSSFISTSWRSREMISYAGHVSASGPLWPRCSIQIFRHLFFVGEFRFSDTFIENRTHSAEGHEWIPFYR
jgi:hypothetical protein